MKFLTKQEIIDDIVSKMTDEDKLELSKLEMKDMIKFHHGVGTFIRNEYLLWDRNNPLTALWFIDTESGNEEFIKDGVDYHPCHPDEVSMAVLNGIWEEVTGNKETRTAEQIKFDIMKDVIVEIAKDKNE